MGIIGTVARMLGIKPVRTMAEKRMKLLSVLERGERKDRHARRAMEQSGHGMRLVAFYQMCARMEDDGLIEGWYVDKKIDGIAVKERWHRVTDRGRKTLEESISDC